MENAYQDRHAMYTTYIDYVSESLLVASRAKAVLATRGGFQVLDLNHVGGIDPLQHKLSNAVALVHYGAPGRGGWSAESSASATGMDATDIPW